MESAVDLVDALPHLGWSASRRQLVDLVGHHSVREAIRSERIVRVTRGRYALPDSIGPAQAAAVRVNGVVSHLSAAIRLGLAVRKPPPFPMVTVPRGRKLSVKRQAGIAVHWSNLPASDVEDGVTTPLRTVLDCAARLPFSEALVVADSALTHQLVGHDELVARAAIAPLQFRSRVLHVAMHADHRPQSALESLVRGHAVGVPRLELVPQVLVAGRHPDLYDERLRMAVECDSYEHHAKRAALISDCKRYNDFALAGLMLIRFAWEHSMHQEDYVRRTLVAAVETRERQLGL